jgi:general secretion pathway protein J
MKPAAGFTLLELLVALFAMALMAVLGWHGLDAMARARAGTGARAAQSQALQAGLAQWAVDLDALAQLPQAAALEWDGRVLRMVRRGVAGQPDGLRVVGWTGRQGHWLRWQSPPLATRGEIAAAWQQAGLWALNPGDEERRHEVTVAPLEEWHIYYSREGNWSHPLSGDERTSLVPDGVRLVLVLPPGQAVAGRIVRDWASPKLAGGKS